MNECFIIDADVELPGCAGREDHLDVEALLDEGRETRSLGFIVLFVSSYMGNRSDARYFKPVSTATVTTVFPSPSSAAS